MILDPSGRPVATSELQNNTAALRAKVGLLTEAITTRHGHLQNSMQGLARSLGQDQLASMAPLQRSAMYFPISLDYTLMGYLYQTHGVLQTMIDEPVQDAFRADDGPGFQLTSREMGEGSVGADGLGELEDFAEEIGAWETLKSTLMWGGLYGRAGVVINAGQDPNKPLDENDVKRGHLDFYDADGWEFNGANRADKVFDFYGQKLDASRVITYGGKRMPRQLRNQLGGWGASEMQRAVEDFNVWLRGRNSIYSTIDKANIDVYGIKDYAQTLTLPGGEEVVRARVQATNQILNFSKALLLDAEDKYEVVNRSFAGVAEVMKELRIGISCATRMPYTKLWGTAAGSGGLSDSAETENENYNALVISRVRTPARRMVRKMLNLMMVAVFGKRYDVNFTFNPLRVLSAVQEEEIKTSKTNRYLTLYNSRLLDSKEMGDLMHKDKLVAIETKAQQGKLPQFNEVPTTEHLFDKEGGDDGKRD